MISPSPSHWVMGRCSHQPERHPGSGHQEPRQISCGSDRPRAPEKRHAAGLLPLQTVPRLSPGQGETDTAVGGCVLTASCCRERRVPANHRAAKPLQP